MSKDDAGKGLYQKALESVHKTMKDFDNATQEEKEPLAWEMNQLQALIEKLETGRIDIVFLGEISTGKSALINALAGRKLAKVGVQGGVTRDTQRVPWVTKTYRIPGLGDSYAELIDTPGINEVDGAKMAELACIQARMADLVLFVTDSDLNDLELSVFRQLIDVHKPVVLVLNKMDLFSKEQLSDLKKVLAKRVQGLIPESNIVITSADPMPRRYIIEHEDGSVSEEMRKSPPKVEELRVKILDILKREGKALIALNSALFAEETIGRLRSVKIKMRNEQARRLILHFCVIKGAAVAMNPVPVADVLGGFGSDAAMVAALGHIYGEEISLSSAGGLAVEIAKSAGWVAVAEWATHVASHIVKGVTVGAGTVLTALPQGMAAAYGSYLVGEAARYYFEHDCGWAGNSPRRVLSLIVQDMDSESILAEIRDELLKKLEIKTNIPDMRSLGQDLLRLIRNAVS